MKTLYWTSLAATHFPQSFLYEHHNYYNRLKPDTSSQTSEALDPYMLATQYALASLCNLLHFTKFSKLHTIQDWSTGKYQAWKQFFTISVTLYFPLFFQCNVFCFFCQHTVHQHGQMLPLTSSAIIGNLPKVAPPYWNFTFHFFQCLLAHQFSSVYTKSDLVAVLRACCIYPGQHQKGTWL